MWHLHWAPWKNIGFNGFRSSQCHVGSNREVKLCVPNKAPWELGTIWDSKGLRFKWEEAVSDILSASTQTQISMPVSANMTPSEIRRLVDVNQIKRIHFGRVAIFSSTRLLSALVEFRPFTTMSEVKVNQWEELSQFLFRKRIFTEPIATNGALLEGFMFAIGWCKCSTKKEQFGLYGSLGKIENTKDEWRNQGANLSSVGRILGQSLQYVGDNLFQNIQNCCKSLGVPSFYQVNCEANIPANQGAFKFASALTSTMNGFKNSPHLDKDALLYALGWWFQADKWTGQIQ
ncbi:hypothetical protein O181_020843 [Austropuccinia psidii MF-1]|uniref:Tet-like 2OG-Fe(II) oxygenase domain-containing protein n=1 Tax=Austropuccinia psidii MF-1 TaxID=1389203 RepID=A0A9Q3CC67_9BASI|nr:hypothetical protein [Austropuccinia psidii MF-1]